MSSYKTRGPSVFERHREQRTREPTLISLPPNPEVCGFNDWQSSSGLTQSDPIRPDPTRPECKVKFTSGCVIKREAEITFGRGLCAVLVTRGGFLDLERTTVDILLKAFATFFTFRPYFLDTRWRQKMKRSTSVRGPSFLSNFINTP